jgi:sterol 3beta-glucosyltransferase
MPAPVTFLAIGSRGDVEPMAVLAGAVAARGRPATVVAVDEYGDLVRAHGARFRGLGPAMAEVARLGSGRLGRLAYRTPLAQPVLLGRWLAGLAGPLASALDEVPAGSPVVTGVASRDAALALVESRGCRMATVLHTAVLPTLRPASHLEGHRLSGPPRLRRRFVDWYWHTVQGLSRHTGGVFRDREGLRRHSAAGLAAAADRHPIWLAADAVLVPPAPDWPERCVQTGAIRPPVPVDWAPAEPLRSFLDAGEPPVHVGLGSLNDAGGTAWLDLLGEAARLSGRRLVVPAVPGGPVGVVTELLCTTGSVPHDALLPRLAGVVHHGGAGTTAAGLRAGVPSACAPAIFDQHYHGRRLAELGVGPAPVPLPRLTAPRLAGLIADVAGDRHRAGAAEAGRVARAVDGTAAVLAELESFAG